MAEAFAWLTIALQIGVTLSAVLTLIAGYRVIVGPTTPDRVVALDVIATNVVAVGLVYAMLSKRGFFLDVSLVLAIIGFISTVTVARYVTEGDIIR